MFSFRLQDFHLLWCIFQMLCLTSHVSRLCPTTPSTGVNGLGCFRFARRYTSVVCNKSLEKVAIYLGLDSLVWDDLNEGVSDSKKSTIIQNVVESTIAAMYLDGGLAPAEKFIFDKLLIREGEFQDDIKRDSKSELQILAQKLGEPIPSYAVMSREGTDNEPLFGVRVSAFAYEATGSGASKKKAEQDAASNLLKQLDDDEGIKTRIKVRALRKLLLS